MLTARIWREIPQRYRLEAGRCAGCGKVHYPPRLVCDGCRGRKFEKVRLSPRGEVKTFTVIRTPTARFASQAPFVVALVELEGGVRIMCQVVDVSPDEVRSGMKVRLQFRRIQEEGPAGVISYGHKAVPV
jgi:uncharacterized OB-fold protein